MSAERPTNTADQATSLYYAPIEIAKENIPVLPPNTRILDIGSGRVQSSLMKYLKKRNPKAQPNFVQLDYFRTNLMRRRGTRVVADALALPFTNGSFPVIVHSEITRGNPYLFNPNRPQDKENLSKMSEEVRRVLSPGGLYIVYNEVAWLEIPQGFETVFVK